MHKLGNSNVLHNEEPCQPKTLQNVKLLEGLTSHETKTSEGVIIVVLENDDIT